MELKEFVSKSLLEIMAGVADAQKQTKAGSIVPHVLSRVHTTGGWGERTLKAIEQGSTEIQTVEFEVTVKADEREGAQGRISVVAGLFGAGITADKGKTDEHGTTLKFRVPIAFPTQPAINS